MLECIKQDLLAQKSRFEQMQEQEIQKQIADAEQKFIVPENQRLDALQSEQLNKVKEEYDSKVNAIIGNIEAQKIAYKNTIYAKVTAATKECFGNAINNIAKQLED